VINLPQFAQAGPRVCIRSHVVDIMIGLGLCPSEHAHLRGGRWFEGMDLA